MNDNDNLRHVTLDGREYSVVFVDLFAGDYFEICLMDVATEEFAHCCTEPMVGVPLIDRQVLIRDEFVELLAEAGVLHRTGEAFEGGHCVRLHRCNVPVREQVPFLERGHSPAMADLRDYSSIQFERAALERDLGDEIEL